MEQSELRIKLRYFAMVREAIGRAEEERNVAAGTTVGALFDLLAIEQPRLAPMRPALLVMVNQEYADPTQPLRTGDEVALIPPVSGGSELDRRFWIQQAVIDPRTVEAAVSAPGCGAIVTFVGTVRDRARGRTVVALEYEAYAPAAEKMLARIGDEIAGRWGIERVAIVHRIGYLAVGEASVAIAIAAPHRGEAFAASQYAIERLKQIVPIWKKEFYDGGSVWVGSEAEYQRESGRLEVGAGDLA